MSANFNISNCVVTITLLVRHMIVSPFSAVIYAEQKPRDICKFETKIKKGKIYNPSYFNLLLFLFQIM